MRLHLPIEDAQRYVPSTIAVLEPTDDHSTIARIGGDADWIARYLAGLECDFDVLEPDSVRGELRALGERLLRVQ